MRRNWILGGLFASVACVLVAILTGAAAWGWAFIRSQPNPTDQTLYQGVTYQRIVRQSPRLMMIHIITIDLQAEGIRFLVTPGNPKEELPLEASTTSQFLEENNLQIAINGDGFGPWYSHSIFNYYPHRGDPVAPIGLAASEGTIYSYQTDNEPVLYIARTNRARFNTPIGKVHNAISGNIMLVQQGQVQAFPDDDRQPRTAVALDKAAKRMILVVVDGRQPNYSEGATLTELAQIIIEQGGYFGMNLDGGGSSTLVKQGSFGRGDVLNSPVDRGVPGWQRPVGNHLGIYAKP